MMQLGATTYFWQNYTRADFETWNSLEQLNAALDAMPRNELVVGMAYADPDPIKAIYDSGGSYAGGIAALKQAATTASKDAIIDALIYLQGVIALGASIRATSATTSSPTSAIGGISTKTWLIIGGIGAAVLLMKK